MRKPNMDALADLCVEHFTVLRKMVGDPKFLELNEIERKIQENNPEYASLYYNVSFTCMPYLEALKVERKHQEIIEKIVEANMILEMSV